jgi:8-oxo-dGTP diphosphatase
MLSDEEFYRSLPTKRMGAGVLYQNEQGEILIVKPTYRPYWLLPGGSVEADESPRMACIREAQEELGDAFPVGRLLVIDYCSQNGYKTESLQFIFDGGVLNEEIMQAIRLPEDELSEYRFVPVEEAIELLSPQLALRIKPALRAYQTGGATYLEQGKEAGS